MRCDIMERFVGFSRQVVCHQLQLVVSMQSTMRQAPTVKSPAITQPKEFGFFPGAPRPVDDPCGLGNSLLIHRRNRSLAAPSSSQKLPQTAEGVGGGRAAAATLSPPTPLTLHISLLSLSPVVAKQVPIRPFSYQSLSKWPGVAPVGLRRLLNQGIRHETFPFLRDLRGINALDTGACSRRSRRTKNDRTRNGQP